MNAMDKTSYIIAGALLLFAALSLLLKRGGSRRHRRYVRKAAALIERLSAEDLAPGQKMSYLRKVSPYVFEEAVLTGFENHGHRIRRNLRYSGDGGVDGQVLSDGKWAPVQCKRYKDHIALRDVKEFAELCRRKGTEGYFVHTGRTGKGSREAARRFGNVRFVSGDRLLELLSPPKNQEKHQ